MSQNIRRGVLAAIAIALIFVVYIAIDAAMVTIELKRLAAGGKRIQALEVAFQWGHLVVLTSIIPSVVLQMFKVKRYAPYLIAGALSGLFALYSFWFEFWETFALPWPFSTTFKARAFDAVLVDVFARMPTLYVGLGSDAFWTVPASCVIGVFCGWLYWFLVVRRGLRRREAINAE